MPRLPADFRISLKRRGGRTYRIELVRNPFNQRFWVRKNGKQSLKLPEASRHADEIAGRRQGQRSRHFFVGSSSIAALSTSIVSTGYFLARSLIFCIFWPAVPIALLTAFIIFSSSGNTSRRGKPLNFICREADVSFARLKR